MFEKFHNYLKFNNVSVFWFYVILCIFILMIRAWADNDEFKPKRRNITNTGWVAVVKISTWTSQKEVVKSFDFRDYIKENHSNAKFMCHEAIKWLLKSPSTAKFPPIYNTQIIPTEWIEMANRLFPSDNLNKFTYIFTTYVDSQNGFWATVRSHFACLFEYNEATKDSYMRNIVSGE